MQMLLSIVLPFIMLILINGTSTYILNRKFGETLPFTIMLIMITLFLTQLIFKTFIIGYIVIVIYALFFIYLLFKKDRIKIKQLFLTNGFIIFSICYIFFTIIYINKNVNGWDELMHWGVMTKEMLRLDSFYSNPLSTLMIHKDYPPFINLFEMAFCKAATRYSEMSTNVAMHIIISCFTVIPLSEKIKKSKFNIAFFLGMLVCSIGLFLAFDPEKTFSTTYNDIVICALFAYGMYLVFCDLKNKSNYIFLVLTCITMLMTKQVGIGFVLIIEFAFLLRNWKKVFYTKRKINYKWLTLILLLIILPILFSKIWNLNIKTLNLEGQFEVEKISIDRIKNIIHSNEDKMLIKNFIKSSISNNSSSTKLPISFFGFYILVAIIYLISIIINNNNKNKEFDIENTILFIAFSIGTIGYAVMMMLVYMFMMSKVEQDNLMCFDRYMATYMLAEIYAWIMIILNRHMEKINIKNAICIEIIIALVLMCTINLGNILVIIPNVFKKDNLQDYKTYAQIIMDNTEEYSTILVLQNEKFKHKGQVYTHYFTTARWFTKDTKTDYFHFNYNNEKETNERLEKIEKNDYLFLIDVSEDFNKAFSKFLLGSKEFETGVVYKIKKNNDSILFEK